MIKKLKFKFISLAMAALFVLMVVLVLAMNIINYISIVRESDEILSLISVNRGKFPQISNGFSKKTPYSMSPETPYESRYFTVVFDDNRNVKTTDVSQIAAIDRETAIDYAETVMTKSKETGFIDDYRYVIKRETDTYQVSFLDCGRKLNSFKSFLYTSSGVALGGLAVIFIAVFILSGKIIKPIAESYEKQKQFITDAGHEIKTPLTIIKANADILKMKLEEDNESLQDIQLQIKRLRRLTDDLVMLSRMEESRQNMIKIGFPISDVVFETAQPFEHLAISQGKEFVCNIQPMLSFYGNDKSIGQLTSLILDNALKYSPAGGTISLTLAKQNRTLCLSCFNTTEAEINSEQLKHIFDRFYRTDSSRNSKTGGHGIGLSVAKAIVSAHGGKITACTKDGHSFQITAVFPI
jgi:signal transduction histidine kinase